MARTYSSTPVLSKVKIGDAYYYLKDADVRGILDSIDDDAYAALQLGMGPVSGNDGKLVSAADIKSYVDSAIAALPEFDIIVLGPSEDLPTASAETWHKIYLKPAQDAESRNIYIEYITVRQGTDPDYTYSWEKVGDTAIDLSGYVTDVTYVAATHKLQQQKGEGSYTDVHTFGALADANQGEATVTDYVTGVQSAKVTASGNIAGGLVSDPTGVQITGSVSAPTVSVTLATKSVQFVDSLGTLPSKAADTFTPASLTTATKTFAKEGIKVSVGTGVDAECLILEAASLETNVKVVDTFSGGQFQEGAFSAGALPTLKAAENMATGVVSTAEATAPTFTGDKFAFTGTFTGTEVDASVTLAKGSKTIVVDPKAS